MSTIINATTTNGVVIQPDNSGSLVLQTNSGTTALTIDTSQNVGIGTASPDGKLDIATGGTTDIVAALGGTFPAYTYRNGTNTWFHAGKHPTNDYFYIGTGATPTTNISMVIDSSGNLLFNSGYGSAAIAYGCRAWVNFNGTGTVAIRASGNVTSITDNGTGDYTINFATAMPDATYSAAIFPKTSTGGVSRATFANGDNGNTTQSASGYRFYTTNLAGTPSDTDFVNATFFR